MRRFTGYYSICRREARPRFYVESTRLARIGFRAGVSVRVDRVGPELHVRAVTGHGTHRVMGRTTINGPQRPVVAFSAQHFLETFSVGEEIKVEGHESFLRVSPTVRAFHIRKALAAQPAFRIFDVCAGGGLFSRAAESAGRFRVVGGIEMEPNFADVFEAAHPDAELFFGDFRRVNPADLPEFDVLVSGLPCDFFSALGRAARKSFDRDPCLMGGNADLFIPFLNLIAERMPLAVCLEQVPAFIESAAGTLVVQALRAIGYHVSWVVLEPHREWNEISDRRRLALVANLRGPFAIRPPMRAFRGKLDDYLDRPDPERDRVDVEHVRVRVACMNARAARHREKGNNFGLVYVDRDAEKLTTITRKYWAASRGPFLRTPQGPRLLRKAELERVMGAPVETQSFIWAAQMLGQGIQHEPWKEIFRQLGEHLVQWKPESRQLTMF